MKKPPKQCLTIIYILYRLQSHEIFMSIILYIAQNNRQIECFGSREPLSVSCYVHVHVRMYITHENFM